MFGVWRCPSLFVRALVRGMSEAGRYCAKRDSPDTMRCSSACGARAVALPSRASRAARPASARGDARSRAVSSRPSQHARDASATGCPLSSTRVAHRGRGLAPAHALPDHISGLGYVPPGRAADPASVPTLAVSQLAASGKGATAQVPTPTATATITVGGWPLVASMGLAAVASLGACGTAFILIMAPALRAAQSASEAAERAASNAERAMEAFEKLSVKTLEDLPRTLDQVESAGKEWDDLGQELREIAGHHLAPGDAPHPRITCPARVDQQAPHRRRRIDEGHTRRSRNQPAFHTQRGFTAGVTYYCAHAPSLTRLDVRVAVAVDLDGR